MIYVTREPILLHEFLSQEVPATCGASAHFIGTVRNHQDGKAVKSLDYECYEAMANRQIGKIVEAVKLAYGVESAQLLHRVGELQVGDIAVAIAVHTGHRAEAFAACREIIEEIKHKVPIWKKELYQDGTSDWVLCSHPKGVLV